MSFNVQLYRPNSAQTAFEEVYVATKPSLVEGLVGADNKILTSMFPSYVFGDMRYVGMLLGENPTDSLYSEIMAWLDSKDIEQTPENAAGKYFIASNSEVEILVKTGHVFITGDDSSSVPGAGALFTINSGDWVVFNRYENETYYWGIVNNTYDDARENSKGVIQLASKPEAEAGSNAWKAMTPARVKDYIDDRLGNVDNTSDLNKPISNATATALAGKQAASAVLGSITALGSGLGILRKTGSNTVTLDTTVYAPETSPDLKGSPTSTTPGTSDSSTRIANTAWVRSQNYTTGVKGNNEGTFRTGNVNITKDNIGLGSVNNYGKANKAQAEAGTSDALYMTPLRTKESIDYNSMMPYYETLSAANADISKFAAGKLIMVKV